MPQPIESTLTLETESTNNAQGPTSSTVKEQKSRISSLRDFMEWRISLSSLPFSVDLDNIPPHAGTSKIIAVAGYEIPLRGQLNWFEEWIIDEVDAYFMYRALDLRMMFSALAKKARRLFSLKSLKEARDLIQTIMQDGESPHDYADFRDENDGDFKAILEESRNLNRGMGDWFIAGIFLKIRADMTFDLPQLVWFGAQDKDAILRAIEAESGGKFKRRGGDTETPDTPNAQLEAAEEEDEEDGPLTPSPVASTPNAATGEMSGTKSIPAPSTTPDITSETLLGSPLTQSSEPSPRLDESETSIATALPV